MPLSLTINKQRGYKLAGPGTPYLSWMPLILSSAWDPWATLSSDFKDYNTISPKNLTYMSYDIRDVVCDTRILKHLVSNWPSGTSATWHGLGMDFRPPLYWQWRYLTPPATPWIPDVALGRL